MSLDHESLAGGLPLFLYRNPDTGVHASFHGYLPEEQDEVGLTFEMALPRPAYFAHEALPLAVQVARELRLDTDPHGPNGPANSPSPSKESLLAVWQEQNARARTELAGRAGPAPACRAEDLEASWEYLTLREDLHWRYGRRGVAVPGIEFVRRRKTGEVLRLCRWSDLGPTIFPIVDLVLLQNPPGPLKDGKILSAGELSEVARRWVRDVPQPIYHRTYLETTPPPDFLDILDHMKGTTMRSYEPVAAEVLDDSI